jgi:hypothetical protein
VADPTLTVRFYKPRNAYEQAGLVPGGPEVCHRCYVELHPEGLTRAELDDLVRCIDDAGNEYDHHLDEPVGAGL